MCIIQFIKNTFIIKVFFEAGNKGTKRKGKVIRLLGKKR